MALEEDSVFKITRPSDQETSEAGKEEEQENPVILDAAESEEGQDTVEDQGITEAGESAQPQETAEGTLVDADHGENSANISADAGSKGYMWIAIVVGLVVLLTVALLLKRLFFDRSKNRSSDGDTQKARPTADPERTIGQIRTTMSEEGQQEQSQYNLGYAQWIGEREDQEDALMVSNWSDASVVEQRGILAAVADGIGGLDDGQIASQTLMQSFKNKFDLLDPEMSPQGKLLELTACGQHEVLDVNRRGKRCGTTLVAALVQGGFLFILSVGDSRIALYRSGVLLQLNREHVNSRVGDEQSAFEGTALVEGRRRAALTSYIGKEELRELDRTLNPIQLISGDRVLLMSDGVFGTVSDDQLAALLNQDAQQAADAIIEQVQMKKNQYQDNATVVVIEVK